MKIILTTSEDHVDENFYYATGISKAKHVTATVIIDGNHRTILTNKLESGLFSGKKIIIESRDQFEKIIRKVGSAGMNMDYISANSYHRWRKLIKIKDVSKEFEKRRAIKTQSELKKIKEACKITTDTLDSLDKLIKKARTEKELARELDFAAMRNGAEATAYPTIVASGSNSALPHHSPTNAKIKKGILLIDFGAQYDGYCSDITRTYFVGKADEKTKRVYEIVKRAQLAGIAKARPNVNGKDVHATAAEIIRKALKQEMIHSFGHGLGINVHETPSVGPKSKDILKRNMVMTAEPGFYQNGWGGVRIEDDLIVGATAITKSPKNIPEI